MEMTSFTEEQLREISQNRNAWLSWPEVQSLARQCLDLMKDLEAAQCDAANSLEVSVQESFRYKASLARAEAAEALLKPFAKVAESDIGSDETDADLFRPMSSRYNRAPLLKVGHLRRAAAHLACATAETLGARLNETRRQLEEARADNSLLNQLEAENDVLRSRALEANTLLEKALAYFRSFDPERIRSFDLERSLRDQIADYLATLAHAPREGGKS